MLRVAVCDDEPIMLNYICKCLRNAFVKCKTEVTVKPFSRAESMISAHIDNRFDIVFLDIMMDGMDGFEAAKIIRDFSFKTAIVFITSQEQYVYATFRYQPFSFIKKHNYADIESSIIKEVDYFLKHLRDKHILTLPLPYGEKKELPSSDILYIKSDNHYLDFMTVNNYSYRTRMNICEAEKWLCEHNFIRFHRQYIGNLKNIRRIDTVNETVIFITKEKLKYGRKYEERLIKQYSEYMRAIM